MLLVWSLLAVCRASLTLHYFTMESKCGTDINISSQTVVERGLVLSHPSFPPRLHLNSNESISVSYYELGNKQPVLLISTKPHSAQEENKCVRDIRWDESLSKGVVISFLSSSRNNLTHVQCPDWIEAERAQERTWCKHAYRDEDVTCTSSPLWWIERECD